MERKREIILNIITSYFGLEDAFDDSMPVCSLLTQDGYSR